MELKEYVLPLLRWWWLVVATVAVSLTSSIIATSYQVPIYRAQTTIIVGRSMIDNPNPTGNDLWLTQQLATTYADMLKRQPVQEATKTALGLSWLPEYTTRIVPNTQLLEVAVTDTDPLRAQVVATELVNQLIRLSPTGLSDEEQQRQDFINRQLDELEIAIEETKAEITAKQEQLATLFSARQIADSQAQIAGLQTKQNSLQTNYASLLSNSQKGALNTIQVIEPASLPTEPVGPNRLYTILAAAAIGLMLAAGAAYLLEYLDDTLKNPDDVQKVMALTTMGAVPLYENKNGDRSLIMAEPGQSAASEAYRILRTNLQFAAVDRPLHKIMVTSAAPGEGKTATTANLAIAQAQTGRRVIIVDADLHKPRQHHHFQLPNNVGLTTALLDEDPPLDMLLQATTFPNLWVMTSGPMPPNPAELLGSARMRQLLEQLRERADIILLDSPPVTALSDATILSTQSDGVLLIVNSGRTRGEMARRAVAALRQVNAHLIGALLNRMPLRGAGYYYYYYYYYQGGYYNEDGEGTGKGNGKKRRGRRQSSSQYSGRQPSQPSQQLALHSSAQSDD